MSEIGFYHLTRTPMEAALPKLLGRVLGTGGRAVVRLSEAARLASLDASLWLCPDPDWLPHGTAEPAMQPIFLTLDDTAPNGAKFLFLVDGADSAKLAEYDRVFDLFDGQDDQAVHAARARWTAAKAAGHTLTYWQQGARGWEKKA
ncbi:DNA polymerase III subunit chi [Roseomonas sp. 18066]|uniref:DNA polymerase III subunit chi n=1 Tax=Roseomonas sp. 18066 TaxID=2681412 RepID=UPI0013580336|nr:DNA polymerase III subunit chi [Roseomonas sp. 18066]